MKIAINGFGRIGKTFLRTILSDKKAASKLEIVAINIGPSSTEYIDLLFKHDSIMGEFPGKVALSNGKLCINDFKIQLLSEVNPQNINWKNMNIEWVVESSGHFTSREGAKLHLNAGAKKVLISAPAKNEDITIIPGVNDSDYNPQNHHIVSLGSCTTNCIVPMIKVIKDNVKLINGMMTTIHSYTNNQLLLDVEHKDPRRARAAALSIIPTKTGAQRLIDKIFPDLKDRIYTSALRVPIPIVSLTDFTFVAETNLSKESINQMFDKASKNELRGIIDYTEMPLVSSDYKGNPHSCIIDGLLTGATNNMGKVFGWYDNEWGYSERLKDFLLHNS